MAKVYFLRHQALGVLHEYPFAAPPTDEQKAAVAKRCFQQAGSHHGRLHTDDTGRKFKKPYWSFDDPRALVEQELLGSDAVIAVPVHSLQVAANVGTGIGTVGMIEPHGTGTVTNPGEFEMLTEDDIGDVEEVLKAGS